LNGNFKMRRSSKSGWRHFNIRRSQYCFFITFPHRFEEYKTGEICFIPLIGERFDGHNYIASALEHGAVGSLTQKETEPFPGKVLIKVSDTLKALRDLAVYYRQNSRSLL